MMEFKLELGDEQVVSACECCGQRSTTVHGFVYASGAPFAVYYAGWPICAQKPAIVLAIATGKWSDDSTAADRVSMGFSVKSTSSQITFSVLDPSETPWGETPLFGKMLPRINAIRHASWQCTIQVAEYVVTEDPRIYSQLA